MQNDFSPTQIKWNKENPNDFSGLKAIFLNCTLKKSPQVSHTEGLMQMAINIMKANNVKTELIRIVDQSIAMGVYPDMTEYGWEKDDWPKIQKKVMDADILVIGTPIWLGEKSSVASMVVERLYANSAVLNKSDQYAFYGKVGGCVITGNEDGVKHCSMNLLYSLQHIGYTIPPQSDCGWVGEIGPGPSYLDKDSGGPKNNFTNKNTTFMTWNLMHMAKMLKDNNGIPAWGNQVKEWENEA
jgi:multimeric flavodoxin WrbA